MRRTRTRAHSGFTLVELLVVMAIMATLMGLLLPAVQKVRESGNRTKCLNNVRQLCLAMNSFNDSAGRLPPVSSLPISPTIGGSSMFWEMLPFIEQDNIFRQGFGVTGPTFPLGAVPPSGPNHQVKTFACPSDITGNGAEGLTSYAGNGLVFVNSTPPSSIPRTFGDGVTNTILFVERYQKCRDLNPAVVNQNPADNTQPNRDNPNLWGAPSTYRSTSWPGTLTSLMQTPSPPPVPANPYETIALAPGGGATEFQVIPNTSFTSLAAPNELRFNKSNCVPGAPQTPHAGAMVVGFADGSVRTISASANGQVSLGYLGNFPAGQSIFNALLTPSGAEVIQDF